MNDIKTNVDKAVGIDVDRREALGAVLKFTAYVAPATVVLLDTVNSKALAVSAAGSVVSGKGGGGLDQAL